ncbi:MAG: flagellar type III secretion system protein FliR [Planctomycetaceae bacterium]|nr:MAG: flagellar type III secretion system protein FliR [Planctomycetaceae bacterium]
MEIPQITAGQIETFILIFLRVSAIIITIPILGNRSVPMRLKGGLSVVVALLLVPFVQYNAVPIKLPLLVIKMCGEVLIGIVIGFAGQILFAGVQLAGQLVGFQMGFAIVNVVDPVSSSQVSIIAQFQYLLALLIFLAVNAHHIFLYAIAESYQLIPPLSFHYSGPLMESILELSKDIFLVAIKTGAPVIAMLLFTSVGLGLIARTVPQMNVFIVGFPLKIAMGLIGIGLTLPYFVKILESVFTKFDGQLSMLMSLM